MKNKAIQERKVLDQFISTWTDFPKGRIFKTESPDFIIAVNPKYLVGIELTILHDPEGKNSTSYPSTRVTKEILEAVIMKKEDKIPLYEKKKLNEIWLIITITTREQMPDYNLDNKLSTWLFHNGFNKVFLFNLIDQKVYPVG